MSIIRIVKNSENPFVMLHKEFLENYRLSLRAKGLLSYLLSKPNDWQVYEVEIIGNSIDGRESVRRAMRELMDAGYISRTRRRDPVTGHYRGYDYRVYEVPVENTTLQKRVNGLIEGFRRIGADKEVTPEMREEFEVAVAAEMRGKKRVSR